MKVKVITKGKGRDERQWHKQGEENRLHAERTGQEKIEGHVLNLGILQSL